VPSIKGQLRWWTRALLGNGKAEYDLFGGIQGRRNGYPDDDAVPGPFVFRLVTPNLRRAEAPLCPHDFDKGRRQALQPAENAEFELHWFPRLAARAEASAANLQKVIDAWLLLGAVGCRSNRAAGSVWRAGYQPNVTTFEQDIIDLKLPDHLAVRVLETDSEKLREVATDTLQGPMVDNALGFVRGNNRKASPLKLKIGRFSDGNRLIAVFDMRLGRASADEFNRAAQQLSQSNKGLGRSLQQAFNARPLTRATRQT
jgi:CRISPR/Cas system CMR-associated protein Cmr1 (group 7 of RAMP superfamily)